MPLAAFSGAPKSPPRLALTRFAFDRMPTRTETPTVVVDDSPLTGQGEPAERPLETWREPEVDRMVLDEATASRLAPTTEHWPLAAFTAASASPESATEAAELSVESTRSTITSATWTPKSQATPKRKSRPTFGADSAAAVIPGARETLTLTRYNAVVFVETTCDCEAVAKVEEEGDIEAVGRTE